ncbi:hypothetical protein BGZ92_002582 [Podila epicladia]|nr:hypothetical protein BGZ92_002582 [Podila epicladia]
MDPARVRSYQVDTLDRDFNPCHEVLKNVYIDDVETSVRTKGGKSRVGHVCGECAASGDSLVLCGGHEVYRSKEGYIKNKVPSVYSLNSNTWSSQYQP